MKEEIPEVKSEKLRKSHVESLRKRVIGASILIVKRSRNFFSETHHDLYDSKCGSTK